MPRVQGAPRGVIPMMIAGRRDGFPVIRLPRFGRATLTCVEYLGQEFYHISTTRAGDRKYVVTAKTDIHPSLWDDDFYRAVALTIGVTEDELRRAVRERREGEGET